MRLFPMLIATALTWTSHAGAAQPEDFSKQAPTLQALRASLPFDLERTPRQRPIPGWNGRVKGPRVALELGAIDTELWAALESTSTASALRLRRATLGGRVSSGEWVRPSLSLNVGLGRLENVTRGAEAAHSGVTGDVGVGLDVEVLRPLTLSVAGSSGLLVGSRDASALPWMNVGGFLRLSFDR